MAQQLYLLHTVTDSNHCPGCKGEYTEDKAHLWIGCDFNESHWVALQLHVLDTKGSHPQK